MHTPKLSTVRTVASGMDDTRDWRALNDRLVATLKATVGLDRAMASYASADAKRFR